MALVSHLLTPAADPPRFGLDHEFAVDSPEFVKTMAGATATRFCRAIASNCSITAMRFTRACSMAIKRAQCSVTVEAYIYWAGAIGKEFADRAGGTGAGRQVRQAAAGRRRLFEHRPGDSRSSRNGRLQIAWYNPIHWYTLGRFNNRTHRKSLIIDGRIAFTGGAGIADHWRGNARGPDEWRDLQVRIEGPAVVPLQTGFAHNWQQATGERSPPTYYPTVEPAGHLAIQTIMSSPETGASSVRTMYYLSVACARESIYIANLYFVPDPVAIDMLIEAKQRGVDVRIMVSGIRNDNWIARHNSVRLLGRLLAENVEIQEFNRTMLHQKTMVVDGLWVTVGTTNFDNRSFAHNEESNVPCLDRTLAEELRRTFVDDLDGCERVTVDRWKTRGVWARLQELAASFLQEQA